MQVYIYVSFLIGADEAGEQISVKELLPCVQRTATEGNRRASIIHRRIARHAAKRANGRVNAGCSLRLISQELNLKPQIMQIYSQLQL